jgi:Ca2+-binding EF-hand superfamily protein
MKRFAIAYSLSFAALLALNTCNVQAKSVSSPVEKIDTDNDGTIDLNEIKASAGNLFTSLEKDSDGTLDAKELRGKISKRDFKAADPDSDGTVSKDELMSYVESLLKASDTDNDGTVDDKELKSKKGQPLLRLVR